MSEHATAPGADGMRCEPRGRKAQLIMARARLLFCSSTSTRSPWTACVRAYFLRYPNPYASHVISVDVLDRSIIHRASPSPSSPLDPSSSRSATSGDTTGTTDGAFILRTTRLILKRGTLPKWAPKGLIKNAESWVLEESEVELDAPFSEAQLADSDAVQEGRKMCTWTRNLDHTTVLAVTEGLVLQERIAKGSRPSDRGSSFEKGKGQEVLSSNA